MSSFLVVIQVHRAGYTEVVPKVELKFKAVSTWRRQFKPKMPGGCVDDALVMGGGGRALTS